MADFCTITPAALHAVRESWHQLERARQMFVAGARDGLPISGCRAEHCRRVQREIHALGELLKRDQEDAELEACDAEMKFWTANEGPADVPASPCEAAGCARGCCAVILAKG